VNRRRFISDLGWTVAGLGISSKFVHGGSAPKAVTATTTDILGPFYRPGAPMRTNINPKGFTGEILNLSGIVYRDDGRTPFAGCLVEVWQCDSDQQYDNTSDDFRYRGAQISATNGAYHFITAKPVPYPAEPGSQQLRPAHIHLRISGDRQQDLVTQIYIAGDPNIPIDPCSSDAGSAHRIIEITKQKNGERSIRFDVILSKEFMPSSEVFRKLTGLYKMTDNSFTEFSRDGDLLMVKWNGQIREELKYTGNNVFTGGLGHTATFDLLPTGEVNVKLHWPTIFKHELDLQGIKVFQYKS
jgi:protocatechuate 3,4-dioxygenase beta subunit